jgi:hypothetical protein
VSRAVLLHFSVELCAEQDDHRREMWPIPAPLHFKLPALAARCGDSDRDRNKPFCRTTTKKQPVPNYVSDRPQRRRQAGGRPARACGKPRPGNGVPYQRSSRPARSASIFRVNALTASRSACMRSRASTRWHFASSACRGVSGAYSGCARGRSAMPAICFNRRSSVAAASSSEGCGKSYGSQIRFPFNPITQFPVLLRGGSTLNFCDCLKEA